MNRLWLRFFLFGVMYLLFGTFVFCHALFDRWAYNEILRHGVTTTGRINGIKYNAGAFNNPYYVIDLVWLDQAGLARTYRTSLSIEFAGSVTRDGRLVKPDIPLKYLEENSYVRPLVIGDEGERDRIVSNDTRWGFGLFMSSLVLIVLLYVVRRKWLGKNSSATTRSLT
jgi:hypothetical protein